MQQQMVRDREHAIGVVKRLDKCFRTQSQTHSHDTFVQHMEDHKRKGKGSDDLTSSDSTHGSGGGLQSMSMVLQHPLFVQVFPSLNHCLPPTTVPDFKLFIQFLGRNFFASHSHFIARILILLKAVYKQGSQVSSLIFPIRGQFITFALTAEILLQKEVDKESDQNEVAEISGKAKATLKKVPALSVK